MSGLNGTPCSITDEDLRQEIIAKLAADERTAGSALRVGVLNAVAHLAGEVDSLEVRNAAEEIAYSVAHIRGVANRIQAPGSPEPARTIHLNLNEPNKDERII